MVRHAPIHRRSGHSDIAICCGRNVRGSSPSTSVVPLSNQVTTLNHKRFKGFKMFSDGHLEMARTFGDRDARVVLSHMAQAWLRLADNCQDAKKVRPAMQQQQQIQPKDDSKKD